MRRRDVFYEDITFDISDTAANIVAQVASGVAQGSGPDSLDEARSVVLRVVRLLEQAALFRHT